ncbi:MAG: glycosyltransferase [Acidobacteriota bacterium]
MKTEAFQQDIYQRYSVLTRLLVAAFPPPADGTVVDILDIGAGPERLAERFLPPYFHITRADVDTAGDTAIVRLDPGQPLPFERDAFPVVIALEVLEHVPAAGRTALIHECARVASSVVVLSCPVASPLTSRAEEIFQALATRISGTTLAFLDEHKAEGLPDAEAIRAALEQRMPQVFDIANSSLPEWLIYNAIDLAYACDFGDGEEKGRFNSGVNAAAPLSGRGPHYRRFFAGCADQSMGERLSGALRAIPSDGDPLATAVTIAESLTLFREDLLRKHAEGLRLAVKAKDRHIDALDQVIVQLQREGRHDANGDIGGDVGGVAEPAVPVPQAPDRTSVPAKMTTKLRVARSRLRTLRLGIRLSSDIKALVARSRLFDAGYYTNRYPDVAASGIDPLVHYLVVGGAEGRGPNAIFDDVYYASRSPDLQPSGLNPLVHYLTIGAAEGRDPHALFDSAYYVASHPEVTASGLTPLAHYVMHGADLRWDPNPLFWTGFYFDTYPDVVGLGMNPLAHYLQTGAGEGRQPSPLFDVPFYRARNPGVAAQADPLQHYLAAGGAEERDPHPLFDTAYYLARHPEVRQSGHTPLAHYVLHGARLRWDPTPLFWTGFYADAYPDVSSSGMNPLAHYVLSGAVEGRNPNPLFEAAFYRSRNADVVPPHVDPLLHYLAEGAALGRDPHPLFSTRYYLSANPDVEAANLNPLVHYLLHGAGEGRRPNPLFDAAYYGRGLDLPPGANPLVHYLGEGARSGRNPHPLFDAAFYLASHPEAAVDPSGALAHYLSTGAETKWDPHPLFSSEYYLSRNPDVAAAGVNPLVHYVLHGAAEGRSPHPYFDGAYYLACNPDVARDGVNPLVHYLQTGAEEGRKPSALFDTRHYLAENPDVAAASVNPLAHYVLHGRAEGRTPNRLFDPAYYLSTSRAGEPAASDPLRHFIDHGAAEGRNPSAAFDTSFYLRQNPDVAAAGLNALAHYLDHGEEEGRRAAPSAAGVAAELSGRFVPPVGLLPWFNPLTLGLDPGLDQTPALNVLVPGLAMQHMSGGPNTALHIAYRLAALGVRVRLISTDAPMSDPELLWGHLLQLIGTDRRLPNIEFADAHDRNQVLAIGRNDLFFATAWWTAQMAKFAIEFTRHKQFVYLVQDYEPLLHAASTSQALAEETYSLDFIPIVNSRLLFDFLTVNGIGRFAEQEFADTALVFEPAVDRSRFFVEPASPDRPRRLLFYARPTTALRNLFELGAAALMDAAARGVFDAGPWELLAMGEPIAPVAVGHGLVLTPAPWLDFEGYAAQMRQADVLLSLMLSPHPSYPPLEMASCGGVTVTTSFGSKTAARLAVISPNILGAPPTVEGVADALIEAIVRSRTARADPRAGALDLPSTWDESLAPILPGLLAALLEAAGAPRAGRVWNAPALGTSDIACGFQTWPVTAYEHFRIDRMSRRRSAAPSVRPDPGLLSLITTAWNTEPRFLEYLAASVFQQDGDPPFEWVIIDNGSDRDDTRRCLSEIASHPAVRLHRIESNAGIAGGMRLALERASGRYVLPVDSDDYLYPDCLRLVAAGLVSAGFPTLLYTDEDKLSDDGWRDPYFKPDWDPVLFANSCYIAHLCAIDRATALHLDCYADAIADGSHDWDTFTRFTVAGHAPVHLPEVLYGWRMHAGSTAANIEAKSYIVASQRGVLTRFLDSRREAARFTIERSPLFSGTPDWWIRRLPVEPRPITTVILQKTEETAAAGVEIDARIPHDVRTVTGEAALDELRAIALDCAARAGLVHLLADDVESDNPEWPWEAMGMIELFEDTVMVGGRIHDGRRLLSSGLLFGFGSGCDAPDRGRDLRDPGYFAQAFKPHSVSAVPADHAIVEPGFLAAALFELRDLPISIAALGPWLGAAARRAGSRVAYSPFISGRVPRGRTDGWDERELSLFRSVNHDLMPERRLLSPHLGLTRETAFLPVTEEQRRDEEANAGALRPEYREGLAGTLWARRRTYALPARVPSLSILTTLYSGTDAPLFAETAASLLRQTLPFGEWIVLAHGPVSAALAAALERLEGTPRVRVLRLPENLGIMGGMRTCLLAAAGDYVIPVDGDDLLMDDALQIVASVAGNSDSAPMLIYSDEDVLDNGGPRSPYIRPDFDPVLNFDSSYIWHLCAIRRDAALAEGLYSDAAMEFCHDWDSVTRIAAIEPPSHVPEVLYHWRHHEASHTNRATQHVGSIDSTRRLLERRASQLPHPSLFEVAEFPVFRGAREWYLRRKPIEPPPIAVIVTAAREPGPEPMHAWLERSAYPFAAVLSAANAAEEAAILRELASAGGVQYVAVVAAEIEPGGDEWIWEAIRLFECHPEVAMCGGRLVDRTQTVVRSCGVLDERGALIEPFAGLAALDPGPFALALKPHLVAAVPEPLYVVATANLPLPLPDGRHPDRRALRLAADAWSSGRTVAYTPLIEARIGDAARLAPSGSSTPGDRMALARLSEALAGRRLGASGLVSVQRRYR